MLLVPLQGVCVGPSEHGTEVDWLLQVIELFKAADKYDVLGLVQECVSRFRQLTGAHEIAPLLQVHSLILLCLSSESLVRASGNGGGC